MGISIQNSNVRGTSRGCAFLIVMSGSWKFLLTTTKTRPRKHDLLISHLPHSYKERTNRSAVMAKDTISTLLFYLWGLPGLVSLFSYHPVQGRKLQGNNEVYVPGLLDLSNHDFGEEVSESYSQYEVEFVHLGTDVSFLLPNGHVRSMSLPSL